MEYLYYPDEKGNYNIPQNHKKHIVHGNKLLNSYYANFDESQISVNGKSFSEVCASNDKYKCISHIQRYLKGIYDFANHEGPKEMANFLTKYNEYRNELIAKGKEKFEDNEYNQIRKEYAEIIKKWNKEWQNYKNNPSYDEERKLLSRMEDSDKEQILYFIKDFKVPATNNQAETDQRNIKIKQKIGKFRSDAGAEIYAIIRSCINTYKKAEHKCLWSFNKIIW